MTRALAYRTPLARLQSGRFSLLQAGAAVVCMFAQPLVAQAQPAAPSQAVVQPLAGIGGRSLNDALSRLARDPRDVAALIDAGKAALAMGDVDAAVGFFNRADQVSPGNPSVKAGLAGALVRSENPFEAIPLVAEAEKAGPLDAATAADRGLAYDLVGDNETAQRHYQQALARGSSDEVVRRLALSYAMAGDKRASEQTLTPLLQRNDKAGWRTRTFALAILGQADEAVAIAYQTLPQDLATAISPYLRYMPRLTPAQQAAAANFGHFPRASEIGRDDPRIAQFAPARRPGIAAADSALIPKGEPLGRNARNRGRSQPVRASKAARVDGRQVASLAAPARTAPPEIQPTRERAPVAAPVPAVRIAAATPPPEPMPSRSSAVAAVQELPPVAPAAPIQGPGFASLEQPAQAPTISLLSTVLPPDVPAPPIVAVPQVVAAPAQALPQPAPVAAPPVAPRPQIAVVAAPVPPIAEPAPVTAASTIAAPSTASALPPPAAAPIPVPASRPTRPRLLEAFADLAAPVSRDIVPEAGAVDIRKITPAREKAKVEEEKPARPTHPSRIWVQVATGREKAALAYDWRRMVREAPDAFRGKQPSISAWGQTNRLLTGPFPSEAAANAYIAQLRRADVAGAFVWTSPAGQVVDGLLAREPAAPEPAKSAKPARGKRRN